ncbi:gliding motility-associated C-terminal domain-containing protein [Phaeodactylibacter xiamenensis]|uniref:T9SS type B sorting domain-containing protein n=1 Tax=Phaeodactylibacter xiamenensis TaxID=1524460 RepID=UPI0024A7F84C|nr:gliding motility-associated C-terminal domain-containing protein [Phaeodactylibacter xiamenensis]
MAHSKLLLLLGIALLSLSVSAQELYFSAGSDDDSLNSYIGIIDLSTCDTAHVIEPERPIGNCTFDRDTNLYTAIADTIYQVDLETGTLSYVTDFGVIPGEFGAVVFGLEVIGETLFAMFYSPGVALGKYNLVTGEQEILNPSFGEVDPIAAASGLTIINGQLVASTWGGGFYQLETNDLSNSQLLFPHPILEPFSNGLGTVSVDCQNSRTFVTDAVLQQTDEILEVNFETQTLEFVCSVDFRIISLFALEESLPPPCALEVNPIGGAFPGSAYQADTACTGAPQPILPPSLELLSEIGFIDSVRVTLSGPGGIDEQLAGTGSDSIVVLGSGSAQLRFLPQQGRPSLPAWEAALGAAQYAYTGPGLPPEGTREIRVVAYAAGNASDTALAYLPIFPYPPSAGEDVTVALCPGSAPVDLFAQLGGSPAPGGQWQPGSGSFDPEADAPGAYFYIQSGAPGCPGDTAVATVSLLPPPVFSLGADKALCQGDTLVLEAPAGLQVEQWQDGSTGLSFTVAQPGDYALQASNSEGCTGSDTITIVYSDFSGLLLETTDVICFEDSTGVLEAMPSGGLPPYAYNWQPVGLGATVTGLPAGTYSVTATDAAGCTFSSAAIIEQPEAPIAVTDTLRRCAGEPFFWEGEPVLSDTLLQGVYSSAAGCDSLYELHLYFSDTVRIDLQADICAGDTFSWEGQVWEQDTSVCMTYNTVAGCDSLTCLELAVAPPVMVSAGADQEVLPGQPVTLSGSSSAAMVQWLPEEGLSCPTCLSTDVELTATQVYQLLATDSLGCTAMDEVQVTVLPSSAYYLPNAFSPNGDGRNDTFGPLQARPGIEAAQFRVFDRWGGLVFERSNLPLEDGRLFWDGQVRGESAPAGVYVWMLEVRLPNGRVEQVQGEVLLLR